MLQTWKLRESNVLNVVVLFFALACFTLTGCKNNGESEAEVDGNSAATTQEFPQFSTEIRSLDDATLNALGAKNDLPTEFVAPGAHYVQAVYPEKIRAFEGGENCVEYFAQNAIENGKSVPLETYCSYCFMRHSVSIFGMGRSGFLW